MSTPFRLLVTLPLGPMIDSLSDLVAVAEMMERVGVDDLAVGDYLLTAAAREGARPFPGPVDAAIPEALTTLAAIASVTTRIGLGTTVLNPALRPAGLLAKQMTTIDHFSGGRTWLAVSRGWLEDEYRALGVDFEAREQILEDTVAACKVLWRDSPATFESEHVSFENVYCSPLPVQAGGPPIYFAGAFSDEMLSRLVRLGDGWFPYIAREEAVEPFAAVRGGLEAAGRDPASFAFFGGLPQWAGIDMMAPPGSFTVADMFEGLPAMLAAGVTRVFLPFQAFVHTIDDLEPFLVEAVDRASAYR